MLFAVATARIKSAVCWASRVCSWTREAHVFVIVGDNDVRERSVGYILENLLRFKEAVWPTRVKFAGHMRRKDLNTSVVANNNTFLSEKLGVNFKSTRLVKREDFDDDERYHFYPQGQGERHLAAMILSVFEEFAKLW